MIVSDLDHAVQQANLTESLRKAFEFLQQTRGKDLPDGRTEIDGTTVYALVQSYQTRAENVNPTFEAHQRYVDVQYLVSGQEIIGWAPLDRVSTTMPYDKEKDALLGKVPGEYTPVRLAPGQLVVLYPNDAHAPGLADGEPSPAKKIIVKVSADG